LPGQCRVLELHWINLSCHNKWLRWLPLDWTKQFGRLFF
jgi:hypothetical protein